MPRFRRLAVVFVAWTALLSLPSAHAACPTLSLGDSNAGIRITEDPACAGGGLGCMNSFCRYCRSVNTTLSYYLINCTDIPAYMSTLNPTSTDPVPAATTSAPVVTTSAPVATTSTPVVTSSDPSSAPAIPLTCYKTVLQGDFAVGLSIVTDQTCSDFGVGCLDSICRLCKRYVTLQSQAYISCIDIPSPPDLSDITFKPIPVVEGDSQTATTDTVVSVTQPPSTPAPSDPVVACSMVVSDGDFNAGLDIVFDPDCLTIGGIGCMPPSACKFCKRFETPNSAVYDDCNAPSTSFVVVANGGSKAALMKSDTAKDNVWAGLVVIATVVCLGVAGFAIVRARRETSGAAKCPNPSPAINGSVESCAELENSRASAEEATEVHEASM